jgi:outer membrane receptor for monomeric catechols
MTYRNKAIHTAILMSGVASMALLSAPALAQQETSASSQTTNDVITVTARRREESLPSRRSATPSLKMSALRTLPSSASRPRT